MILFGGLSIVGAVATAWFIVETDLLEDREAPITWYTRNFLSWHPVAATAGACIATAALTAAVVHFVADREVKP
jgi:hypothetical protein